MNKGKIFFIALCAAFLCFYSVRDLRADFDRQEPLLTAIGTDTADVLRPGEMFFSPWGFAAIGLTENITLEWDWLLGLGGMPGGFVRIKIMEKKDFSLAAEFLDYYLDPKKIGNGEEDLVPGYPFVGYRVTGNMGFLHLAATGRLSEKTRLHAVGGVSYHAYYKIWRKDPLPQLTAEHRDLYSPDAWVGLEHSHSAKLKSVLSALYGNSFAFNDGIPQKLQVFGGLAWAPFPETAAGIFGRLRINFVIVNTYYLEVSKEQGFLPYLYFYWQFPLVRSAA